MGWPVNSSIYCFKSPTLLVVFYCKRSDSHVVNGSLLHTTLFCFLLHSKFVKLHFCSTKKRGEEKIQNLFLHCIILLHIFLNSDEFVEFCINTEKTWFSYLTEWIFCAFFYSRSKIYLPIGSHIDLALLKAQGFSIATLFLVFRSRIWFLDISQSETRSTLCSFFIYRFSSGGSMLAVDSPLSDIPS